MAQGKVEICGVNTARLPLLKTAEKEALFKKSRRGTPLPGKNISKGTCVLSSA